MPPSPALPIIIIGAGIAGLRAAQVLTKAKVPVIILEARGYVGGRVQSIPHGNNWLEMGASWLHGYGQHPLKPLLAKQGLKTFFTDYNTAHAMPGVGPSKGWHTLLQRAIQQAAKTKPDAPLANFLDEIPMALKPIVTMEIEQYYGAPLNKLSAHNFDAGSEPEADDYMVLGDWGNWVNTLATDLNIRLNTPVETVEVTATGLYVRRVGGAVFQARAVINTMPLGVLQQPTAAAVLPALPPRHGQAIKALGMGNLEKLFFTAPYPTWPRQDVMIANHPLLPLWYDVTPLLGTPTLMVLAGMSALATLPKHPTAADWLALATPALRQLVPTGPLPTLVAHSAWHDDPFSHGSYSYYAVGSSPADRKTLQKPWLNNRYWLAGEATDINFPANVQGAWRSGERVAKALIKTL